MQKYLIITDEQENGFRDGFEAYADSPRELAFLLWYIEYRMDEPIQVLDILTKIDDQCCE